MADAPIEVPNDVQVNYSADGITMNLFSIFENKSMNTDFLFEIMKNKIGENKVDYLYIFIKFNPDDTLTFLYAPTPSSAQIVSIESFFSVNNITEEFIKNAKLENPHLNKEEIFNFYTLLVFLWITHIIQSLKKTNITSFLKDTGERMIQCLCAHVERAATTQKIHKDDALFLSLTYDSPTLTPEIVLVPRLNKYNPEIKNTHSQRESYPLNMNRIFYSIQERTYEYNQFKGVSPVLRFNIDNFTTPTFVFSDFTIFHATPHTDETYNEEGIIQNMEFDMPNKSQVVNYIPPLVPCKGRQNCTLGQMPAVRSILALTFDLLDDEIDSSYKEYSVSLDTLQPVLVVDMTPDTFVPIIESIIQTGMLGNIRAKGKKRRIRKTRKNIKKTKGAKRKRTRSSHKT